MIATIIISLIITYHIIKSAVESATVNKLDEIRKENTRLIKTVRAAAFHSGIKAREFDTHFTKITEFEQVVSELKRIKHIAGHNIKWISWRGKPKN